MSAEGWPAGFGLVTLDEVDSTNAHAARMAGEPGGVTGPVWISATRQTAARGRRGRPWAMPPGNLAATLLMVPRSGGGPASGADAALRSFVASLALYDAFAALHVPHVALALKWPNDVLLNGGKVAGILLESGGQGGAVSWLAVGFGVNLVAAPHPSALEPGAISPVCLLSETGLRVERHVFLTRLAVAFARHEAALQADGFAPLRDLWLSRAARLGEPITARTLAETVTGRFETLDGTGALVIRTADGPRAIAAADVYF